MEQKYFVYNIDEKEWQETKDKTLAGDIDMLSKALANQDEDKGYMRQNLLWAVTDFSLFDIRYDVVNIYAPVRWRVQASERSKVVIIIGECCNVVQNQSRAYVRWQDYLHNGHKPIQYQLMRNVSQISLRLDYKNWKYTAIPSVSEQAESGGAVYNYRIDWTMPKKAGYVDIPEPVVKCAMDILQEFAKEEFGFNPTEPVNMKGAELLKSFVRYPLDPSVAFWVDALDFSFGMKILRNAPTNFEAVCEALGLPPSKGLKKAYHENSKCLMLIYYINKFLEINDPNVWQLFYDGTALLENDLCNIGIDGKGMLYSRGAIRPWNLCSMQDNNDDDEPLSSFRVSVDVRLKRYYLWASQKWSALVAGIHIRQAVYNWNDEIGYLLRTLDDMEYGISEENMQLLHREGLCIEVNDAVAREGRERNTPHMQKWILDNKEFDITKAELQRECETKNGKFVVARNGAELLDISNKMLNCVYTYSADVHDKVCTIYTFQHDGEYLACIEVRKGAVVQALGVKNKRLYGVVLDEVKEWALKYNLDFKA